MKAVRDKIPDDGKISGSAFTMLLMEKLKEEADEIIEAYRFSGERDVQVWEDKITMELGDLYEVMISICHRVGIPFVQVTNAADIKRKVKGGFTEGRVRIDG